MDFLGAIFDSVSSALSDVTDVVSGAAGSVADVAVADTPSVADFVIENGSGSLGNLVSSNASALDSSLQGSIDAFDLAKSNYINGYDNVAVDANGVPIDASYNDYINEYGVGTQAESLASNLGNALRTAGKGASLSNILGRVGAIAAQGAGLAATALATKMAVDGAKEEGRIINSLESKNRDMIETQRQADNYQTGVAIDRTYKASRFQQAFAANLTVGTTGPGEDIPRFIQQETDYNVGILKYSNELRNMGYNQQIEKSNLTAQYLSKQAENRATNAIIGGVAKGAEQTSSLLNNVLGTGGGSNLISDVVNILT